MGFVFIKLTNDIFSWCQQAVKQDAYLELELKFQRIFHAVIMRIFLSYHTCETTSTCSFLDPSVLEFGRKLNKYGIISKSIIFIPYNSNLITFQSALLLIILRNQIYPPVLINYIYIYLDS